MLITILLSIVFDRSRIKMLSFSYFPAVKYVLFELVLLLINLF